MGPEVKKEKKKKLARRKIESPSSTFLPSSLPLSSFPRNLLFDSSHRFQGQGYLTRFFFFHSFILHYMMFGSRLLVLIFRLQLPSSQSAASLYRFDLQ